MTWTNHVTVHFDVVLKIGYMSIHMVDRVSLAKVVLEHEGGY